MTDALDLNNRVFCVRVKIESATIDGFYQALLDFINQTGRSPRHCFCSTSDYATLSNDMMKTLPGPVKAVSGQSVRLGQVFGLHITEIAECTPGTILLGFFSFDFKSIDLSMTV